MPRKRFIIPLLLLGGACAPALQPLPPLAPLPEPPAESTLPGELIPDAALTRDLDLATLRKRGLMVPVLGVSPWQIPDSYDAARDGGRRHDAQDILAPRGTPVLAADEGVILRIGTNALGGNVIWAADSERRFAYYYAHLDHYARDLREGMRVKRGDIIGFVGTTGNAPADAPHLHFQVMRILDERRYANGPPLNALPFFTTPGVTR